MAAATLPAASANAQMKRAELADATLEELMRIEVTTATLTTERLADAPARMQVITDEQIRRRGYRSLPDVLKDLVDFKLDLGGDPDFPAQLTVQGTRGANQLVVLLDGARISSPTNEPLPILANYPVHAARQIEILYGPASAVYGADAFAGVINIVSKTGAASRGLTASTSLGAYGLYDQSATFGMKVGAAGSLLVAGQFVRDQQPDLSKFYPEDFKGLQGQRTGTFNTIFGPMSPARPVSPEYDNPLSTYSLQAGFQTGGARLTLFANRSRAPTSPPYTPDNAIYNDVAFNDNRLLLVSGGYARTVGRVTSTSTVTFTRHELHPESGYWNVFSNMRKSYKYAYGSMLKLDEQLVWKATRTLTLATGATVERLFAIPQGADLNAPIVSRDVPGTILDTDIPDDFVKLRYTNSGAYVQAQYAASRRASLTLGVRGDYNTRYGATVNPRLGLILRPHDATTVKVMYGAAYLAPSPYEAYAHYGSFYTTDGGATYASDYWHLPNPDLRPQRKKTIEMNVLQRLGTSFGVSASVFVSRFADLRVFSDPDRAYAGTYHGWPVAYIDFAVNDETASTYGGTAALDYVRSFGPDTRLAVRAALSLADGHSTRETGGIVTRLETGGMAPMQLRFGADLDWGRWSLAPRLGVTGRQRLMATELTAGRTRRRTLDGYTTVDVNVRRNLRRHVDAFVTVENAMDVRYRHVNVRAYTNPEELIGAPQNPRRVRLGFDIRIP